MKEAQRMFSLFSFFEKSSAFPNFLSILKPFLTSSIEYWIFDFIVYDLWLFKSLIICLIYHILHSRTVEISDWWVYQLNELPNNFYTLGIVSASLAFTSKIPYGRMSLGSFITQYVWSPEQTFIFSGFTLHCSTKWYSLLLTLIG